MHGKLVFSHSRSTVFLVKRLSIALYPTRCLWSYAKSDGAPARARLLSTLFGEGEVGFTGSGNVHRLGLSLHAFVPGHDVVLAIRNVVDLVVPAGIGLSEVGSGADDDIARHLGVHVAQQRHHTWRTECEWPLFALRPRAQIVSVLLVAADRRPKHIVLHVVTILEFHRSSYLHDQKVWTEHQALLVHQRFLGGSRERLAGDCIHVNNRGFSWRYRACDCSRKSSGCESENQNGGECKTAHVTCPFL